MILGLVKYATKVGSGLSCLRRVGSGAAPLSKEVADGFRERFPWEELKAGIWTNRKLWSCNFFLLGQRR